MVHGGGAWQVVQSRGPRAKAGGQGGGGAGTKAREAGAVGREAGGPRRDPGAPLRIVARGAGGARGEEGPSPAQTYPGATWR